MFAARVSGMAYRKQIRPVIVHGADVMDRDLPK
jgi:hypothetical protein